MAKPDLRVDGGEGNDVGAVSVEGNVAETAMLVMRLDGGRGDDDLSAQLTGDVDGEARLRVDGGDGNDRGAVTVEGDVAEDRRCWASGSKAAAATTTSLLCSPASLAGELRICGPTAAAGTTP